MIDDEKEESACASEQPCHDIASKGVVSEISDFFVAVFGVKSDIRDCRQQLLCELIRALALDEDR